MSPVTKGATEESVALKCNQLKCNQLKCNQLKCNQLKCNQLKCIQLKCIQLKCNAGPSPATEGPPKRPPMALNCARRAASK
jgi:hypothetical protein